MQKNEPGVDIYERVSKNPLPYKTHFFITLHNYFTVTETTKDGYHKKPSNDLMLLLPMTIAMLIYSDV